MAKVLSCTQQQRKEEILNIWNLHIFIQLKSAHYSHPKPKYSEVPYRWSRWQVKASTAKEIFIQQIATFKSCELHTNGKSKSSQVNQVVTTNILSCYIFGGINSCGHEVQDTWESYNIRPV